MTQNNRKQKGSALIMVIFVIITMIGLSMGLMMRSMADDRETRVSRDLIKATALAEGATETAARLLLTSLANYQTPPTTGTVTLNGHAVTYTITAVGAQRIETDAQGVQTIIQPYSIAADAASTGLKKHIEKIIDAEKTPIFQYMCFYNPDLEMLPGPSMNLVGRVFSNGNIYIGSGNTLTLNTEYVRSVGKMYRMRKDDNSASTGTVNIKVKGVASYLSMESKTQFAPSSAEGFDSKFLGYDANHNGIYTDPGDYQNWTLRNQALWKGSVQTAENGVTQIETPSVGTTQIYAAVPGGTGGNYNYNAGTGTYFPVTPGTGAYDKGYFYQNAGMSIINGVAYDMNGVAVTWPVVGGVSTNPITTKTMYDARQGTNVTLTDINMSKLSQSGKWPSNGLLYAARTDATPTHPNGIRLSSASTLAAPLTVVSADPVYTKGDYNKGDGTHPKQPAAVIADAFNILSNSWNDTKTAGHLPVATETTVDAAFISGSMSTHTGGYNGGFENLPRFHENWDAISCHIRGSFVNIWDSADATGSWVYGGDKYTAPVRDWNYDTDFNNFTKLPPFTPCVVGTKRVVWVSR